MQTGISSRMISAVKWLILVLINSVFFFPAMAETSLSENQAKAALLYNFIKHTEWPNESTLQTINVAFIGHEKGFFNEFKTVAEEIVIRGKKVTVTQLSSIDNLNNFHAIVLSPAINFQLKNITSSLLRTNTLIITDNATDQKLVMINFLHPTKDSLSFEVNKSNIVYEGLKISNDVLLHGGTEIEVATLYKEMEYSLKQIKDQVALNNKDLADKLADIETKNREIVTLKEQTLAISNELNQRSMLLNDQQQRFQQLEEEFNNLTLSLNNNKQQLQQQQLLVKSLADEISEKQNTLKIQETKIHEQKQVLGEKTKTVNSQETIINSQRNVIVIALALLLLFLLLIIQRQRQASQRDKLLLETKAELIKAQEESIAAFESSIKLKNDFLTAISHEMRTPMNGIWGALQIADIHDAGSILMSMQMIERSSADMMNLVDDILIYIEIQSEQMELQHDAVSMTAFFNNLRQHYTPLTEQKNLQLNWHISNDIAPWLILDKSKLNKVMHKLMDNALKFTDAGAITLIAIYQDGKLRCTVKDTGKGIQEEDLDNIYEAFWQKETGFQRKFNGLGIGLTICKKMIGLMHGSISVNSRPNLGAQFFLEIPAEVTTISNPLICMQMDIDNQPVLIVEDNTINQQVLRMMLEKLGYSTLVANDGVEALAVIKNTTPSLILMDLQMPNMDGFSCTRAIRQMQGPLKTIPIIAVTANLMESQQVKCIEAGMNNYLSKPLDIKQLEVLLQQYLSA